MSYKFSFADNEVYSSTDINEITKRLVTSGIEDSFTDGVAYNVSKFNDAGSQLYTAGVVPEDCLTLKVSKAEDGKILINPGLAFFNDGAVIEIEAGGETLSYILGAKNYVYLKNDLKDKNICYPCCTTDTPEGDYVLLAEIDEQGKISDKRNYARGKLPGYQSNANSVLYLNEKITATLNTNSSAYGSAQFDIGANNFNYIMIVNFEGDTSYNDVLSIYRISDGRIIGFCNYNDANDAKYSTEKLFSRYRTSGLREYVGLSFVDGILSVDLEVHKTLGLSGSSLGVAGSTISVPINLILF